jgi:phage terminase large subunit GpA-like protein
MFQFHARIHRHKRKNNAIHFNNGMVLWILGAHNKTNLQRRSIRWLVGDETWRWPEGHMAEAEARVTAFGWSRAAVLSITACTTPMDPIWADGVA